MATTPAGKTLDQFRTSSRPGKGGMAIVYKAEICRHRAAGAQMEELPAGVRHHPLKLFQREATIIEGFNHPQHRPA